MINLFNSGISIEKMAAFLDGNLPADEMRDISAAIDNNDTLQHFMETSSVVDEALSSFSDSDFDLPEVLKTPDFELPSLEGGLIVPFSVDLAPVDNDMIAACSASAADDMEIDPNEAINATDYIPELSSPLQDVAVSASIDELPEDSY